jgi:hypothetical protein
MRLTARPAIRTISELKVPITVAEVAPWSKIRIVLAAAGDAIE